MIRTLRDQDLTQVMEIWLNGNLQAHDFLSEQYWKDNYEFVRESLPKAEVCVYQEEGSHEIQGFIGLMDSYIAGIFVRQEERSKGIGKQLLNYAKSIKSRLTLSVYAKNVRAVEFYKREGFSIQKEDFEEPTGEKAYFMVWD